MEQSNITRNLEAEISELRARLEEVEEALQAIRNHEVDALLIEGPEGPKVYTLQGAEQPYRVFIESMNEGAVTMASDGSVLHCNTQFAGVLERTLNTIIGSSLFDLMPPQHREPFLGMIRTCDMEGCKGEFVLSASNGREVPVYLSVKPLSREMEVLCVVVTDLTELKKAEEALRNSKEKLELQITERQQIEEQLLHTQKMEAIGTLSGGIAHDFNNILAGIIGYTEMALDNLTPDDPARRSMELVLKSGFRGRDLVRQILSFSRKAEHKREPVSLTPLVSETLKLVRASLPSSIGIKISENAHWDVVFANSSELQQIIMNLCTNAAYAMKDRGGELEITLAETDIGAGPSPAPGLASGQYVEIIVKDTGTGMDPAVQKRIFEPFFTTKGAGQGSGMGLAVVYGVVKSLNGDIVVRSTPGHGSTFRVFLPKIAGEVIHEAPKELPRGTERILFVDDEELLVELGKGVLRKLGYKVVALTDSLEALEVFSKNPARFDLVFTDQTMPGISGLQLAQEMLKIRADLPIVLITGHSESVSWEKAMAAGVRDFLMKPLSRQELAVAVRRALDGEPAA